MKKIAALFIIFGFIFISATPSYAKCSNVGSVIGGVVAGVAIGAIATNALSRPCHPAPPPLPPKHRPPHKKPCHCKGPVHINTCCNYAYPAYINYGYRIR